MTETETAMFEATYNLLHMNLCVMLEREDDVGFVITIYNKGLTRKVSLKVSYKDLLYCKPSEIYKFIMNAKDCFDQPSFFYCRADMIADRIARTGPRILRMAPASQSEWLP